MSKEADMFRRPSVLIRNPWSRETFSLPIMTWGILREQYKTGHPKTAQLL